MKQTYSISPLCATLRNLIGGGVKRWISAFYAILSVLLFVPSHHFLSFYLASVCSLSRSSRARRSWMPMATAIPRCRPIILNPVAGMPRCSPPTACAASAWRWPTTCRCTPMRYILPSIPRYKTTSVRPASASPSPSTRRGAGIPLSTTDRITVLKTE